jgi:hypothetical protein
MDFQTRNLTIISLVSGLLLILSSLLQSKSGAIDGQIIMTSSQRNIEAFDYMLLNRKQFSGNVPTSVLSAKQLLIEEYDKKIADLVKDSQSKGKCMIWLTTAIIMLNLSSLFPITMGNKLRSSKTAFLFYCFIVSSSIVIAIITLLVGNPF